MTRRRLIQGLVLLLAGIPTLWFGWAWITYPSDRTPEGAYFRVVHAVNSDSPEDFFAYIETRAQHAAYTIRDYRRRSLELVEKSYPDPERSRLLEQYKEEAAAPDGKDLFAIFARRLGWMDRLRKDLSGIAKIEIEGERATVETVRGTRYPFRRRENGIWGLTLFTPTLVAEAEKAARDFAMIERAAADYERAKDRERTGL